MWQRGRGVVLLLASTAIALGAAEAARLEAKFSSQNRSLEIHAPQGATELRLRTSGLDAPEVGDDVGEPGEIYLPLPAGETDQARLLAQAQNVYFFNELGAADGWELVVRFGAEAYGTWKLNGRFSPLGGDQHAEVAIPADALEPGENLLHLRGPNRAVPEMYFRRRLAAEGASSPVTLPLIPADWGGRVEAWNAGQGGAPKLVATTAIAPAQLARRKIEVPARWWEHRALVREAALAAGGNVLNAQVRRADSLFAGGFHLVYDPTRRAHRMAHWLWAWGPSIDFLLRISQLETNGARAAEFRRAALTAAERSLSFEMRTPQHPAHGILTVRWEPSRATPQGWTEYLSTADSLFLAGWGWMSAHAATGDQRYVRHLESLVKAAERLMGEYPVVPQDWIVERGRWTPHTLDESLFGMIGFRRLHAATQSPAVARAGQRFLDSHLKHMGRESGQLARAWLRDEDRDIWDPDIKGHAWVIEGYLDGYRLARDEKYLAVARELAAKVMECQAEDGSWTYLFKRPEPGDMIDDKGTAIWAYLFYDLHQITRDPAHLAAARRALGWCLRQQYRGEDPNLDGAIYHPCSMAYVKRRAMTVLYTTTFFGLALLEELALDERR